MMIYQNKPWHIDKCLYYYADLLVERLIQVMYFIYIQDLGVVANERGHQNLVKNDDFKF